MNRALRWLVGVSVIALAVLPWCLNRAAAPAAEFWRAYTFRQVAGNVAVSYGLACLGYLVAGRGCLRTRVLRIVALTLTGAVCVVVAELPALAFGHDYRRTFGTWAGDTWLDHALAVNRPDSELLHVHWPNTEWKGAVLGNLAGLGIPNAPRHRVDVRYDRNGFRNDKDLDQADVVVIGDSFVEAPIIRLENTVAKQLEARLGATTANLGQTAYGLQQELVVLKRVALPLKPQLVLWFLFGGNDLRDVTAYEWGRTNLDRIVRPTTLARRSLTRNAILALSRLTTPGRTELGESARQQSGLLGKERVYFSSNTLPWNDHEWKVCVHSLAAADRLCREQGIRFVVVYVPRKFTVYVDLVETAPDTTIATWKRTTLPETLGAWCKTAGVEFVDLIPKLREAAASGRPPYFPDDGHWNAEGHRIAAESVALFLSTTGWRPK